MTAVVMDAVPRVDFEHALYVLPPMQYPGGDARWVVYLDDPSKWHRSFTTVAGMLQATGTLLVKLSEFERSTMPLTRGHRTPNCTVGNAAAVPNIPPRWTVLVGASYSEDRIEWWLELQDESAWREEGYDLPVLLQSLERRISAARVPVQSVLSTVPPPPRTDPPVTPPSLPVAEGAFLKLARDEMARIDTEIGRHKRAIAGVETKLAALNRERRGLTLALSTYEKHVQKGTS